MIDSREVVAYVSRNVSKIDTPIMILQSHWSIDRGTCVPILGLVLWSSFAVRFSDFLVELSVPSILYSTPCRLVIVFILLWRF